MTMQYDSVHISPNTVQGSLLDASISRLLDSCRTNLVTGRIDVDATSGSGWIELRAGVVEAAYFGNLTGGRALERLRNLGDGDYEISQRLPDLDGDLGSAASFRGDLQDVSLVELMRHCEDHALTCTIVIVHEFDRGEIEYRGGEISRVAFNGVEDEDRIVDMVRLRNARFLVSAPPLDIGVAGWPVVRGDPTEPFQLDHLMARPKPQVSELPEPAPLPPTPLPGMSALAAPLTQPRPAAKLEPEPQPEPEPKPQPKLEPKPQPKRETKPDKPRAAKALVPSLEAAREAAGEVALAKLPPNPYAKTEDERKKGSSRKPKRRTLRGRLGGMLRRASRRLGRMAERLAPAEPEVVTAKPRAKNQRRTTTPEPQAGRKPGRVRRFFSRMFGRRSE